MGDRRTDAYADECADRVDSGTRFARVTFEQGDRRSTVANLSQRKPCGNVAVGLLHDLKEFVMVHGLHGHRETHVNHVESLPCLWAKVYRSISCAFENISRHAEIVCGYG
jgi:hypothetical protein